MHQDTRKWALGGDTPFNKSKEFLEEQKDAIDAEIFKLKNRQRYNTKSIKFEENAIKERAEKIDAMANSQRTLTGYSTTQTVSLKLPPNATSKQQKEFMQGLTAYLSWSESSSGRFVPKVIDDFLKNKYYVNPKKSNAKDQFILNTDQTKELIEAERIRNLEAQGISTVKDDGLKEAQPDIRREQELAVQSAVGDLIDRPIREVAEGIPETVPEVFAPLSRREAFADFRGRLGVSFRDRLNKLRFGGRDEPKDVLISPRGTPKSSYDFIAAQIEKDGKIDLTKIPDGVKVDITKKEADAVNAFLSQKIKLDASTIPDDFSASQFAGEIAPLRSTAKADEAKDLKNLVSLFTTGRTIKQGKLENKPFTDFIQKLGLGKTDKQVNIVSDFVSIDRTFTKTDADFLTSYTAKQQSLNTAKDGLKKQLKELGITDEQLEKYNAFKGNIDEVTKRKDKLSKQKSALEEERNKLQILTGDTRRDLINTEDASKLNKQIKAIDELIVEEDKLLNQFGNLGLDKKQQKGVEGLVSSKNNILKTENELDRIVKDYNLKRITVKSENNELSGLYTDLQRTIKNKQKSIDAYEDQLSIFEAKDNKLDWRDQRVIDGIAGKKNASIDDFKKAYKIEFDNYDEKIGDLTGKINTFSEVQQTDVISKTKAIVKTSKEKLGITNVLGKQKNKLSKQLNSYLVESEKIKKLENARSNLIEQKNKLNKRLASDPNASEDSWKQLKNINKEIGKLDEKIRTSKINQENYYNEMYVETFDFIRGKLNFPTEWEKRIPNLTGKPGSGGVDPRSGETFSQFGERLKAYDDTVPFVEPDNTNRLSHLFTFKKDEQPLRFTLDIPTKPAVDDIGKGKPTSQQLLPPETKQTETRGILGAIQEKEKVQQEAIDQWVKNGEKLKYENYKRVLAVEKYSKGAKKKQATDYLTQIVKGIGSGATPTVLGSAYATQGTASAALSGQPVIDRGIVPPFSVPETPFTLPEFSPPSIQPTVDKVSEGLGDIFKPKG
ncbi:MAG: hypothetical protein ACE5SV_08710, partial [Candidatus Nitrosomaritimum aestuariumsis]